MFFRKFEYKRTILYQKYNSYINFPNSNGYNLTLGGEGNQKTTEEKILKIIKLWEEGKTTGEISLLINIEKHAIIRYLKLFSSYTVEEADLRGRINAGISHKKKIDCYDLWGNFLKTYPSIREAAKELNLAESAIVKCCKGKSPRVKEYRFTYEQEIKKIDFNNIFKDEWVIKLFKGKDTLIFPSIMKAAKFINISNVTLKKYINTGEKIKGWLIEGKRY